MTPPISARDPPTMSLVAVEATRAPPNQAENVKITLEENVSLPYAEGAFAKVYLAKLTSADGTHREQVAIKKCIAKISKDEKRRNREISMFNLLQRDSLHSNIVHLLYHFQTKIDSQTMCTWHVFEFVACDLSKHLRPMRRANPPQRPAAQLARVWSFQLFMGLDHINRLSICHRDLKPANLLLNPITHLLKIADFGSARVPDGLIKPMGWYVVTRYYRPPEMLMRCPEYYQPSDWWSAGCVMAEMCTAQPLFDAPNTTDQIDRIANVFGKPTRQQLLDMKIPLDQRRACQARLPPRLILNLARALPQVDSLAVQLCGQLLQYSPKDRLSPRQALASDYFQAFNTAPNNTLPDGQPLPFKYEISVGNNQVNNDTGTEDEDDSESE